MRHWIALVLLLFFVGVSAAQNRPTTQVVVDRFDAKDLAVANTLVETLNIADWLGPMAPVALSPFFGMTVLSGLALYGPTWATDTALLSAAGPLHSQTLFVVFVVLTLLTSLPRLSKVSKPLAQAADQLETYSVIIMLMVVKFLATGSNEPTTEVAMVQLGMLSVSADVLLAIAMIINIVVINSVKFFFEILIWLTPIPAVDAMFELANKALCGVLMAVYALSPTVATIINLALLLSAAVIFRWASRQLRFFRSIVVDLLLSRIWPRYGARNRPEITVFLRDELGPFRPRCQAKLTKTDDGWRLTSHGWFTTATAQAIDQDARPTLRRGMLMHTIDLMHDGEPKTLNFSRRHDCELEELITQLGLRCEPSSASDLRLNPATLPGPRSQ